MDSVIYQRLPLLARGRDRLETLELLLIRLVLTDPLLARGRDRLETQELGETPHSHQHIPYSLGDAIDWKR